MVCVVIVLMEVWLSFVATNMVYGVVTVNDIVEKMLV
jgi:hypothetical protein